MESTLAATKLPLTEFIHDFGEGLLAAVSQTLPPVYTEKQTTKHFMRQAVMDNLKRQPFAAQADVVQAVAQLLIDENERSAVVNGEMGCGKSQVAICAAAVMHKEGYRRTLVISPPHLVYKWRREILMVIPNARVWVLNGPDTLAKLLQLRAELHLPFDGRQEFFILGRVRMRMGYHWRLAYNTKVRVEDRARMVTCPDCGTVMVDSDGTPFLESAFQKIDRQFKCGVCRSPLWTLMRPRSTDGIDRRKTLVQSLCQIPTIGQISAGRLLDRFGEAFIASMLADNVHEFINLMDEQGEFIFTDRQARRMERALSTIEFSWGQGGYQPTEYIKRYLPDGYFDLLVVDEAHEYKNANSAQGQAMGVLAAKCKKAIMLTGTLMGGYADDLFFLLFRLFPNRMIEDGFRPKKNGSLGSAAHRFMEQHGVLKTVFKETDGGAHKTAKGKKMNQRTSKAPGFGPQGIQRFVLPYTAFLKLEQIGGNVLPSYTEEFVEVEMSSLQREYYSKLAYDLGRELKSSLVRGDVTLLGVVLNVLLAWPDCCFREEIVRHPNTRALLASVPPVFEEEELMPKEEELIDICLREKKQGRRVLAYTVYTQRRDTTQRLKQALEKKGLKVAVLKASVDTMRREDWIIDQVDRGIDVLICNPELVKTGLDLLDFPTIVFLQTGFNTYTLQQAARRSWRIGQTQPVRVFYLGYAGTAQIDCLKLMAKKVEVAQSTSGDIPESGLDVLNSEEEDSIEMALARQLVK